MDHHRAGPDSKATAELCLRAFDSAGLNSFEELSELLQIKVGQLNGLGYTPCGIKRTYKNSQLEIIGDPTKHNSDSIFYGKTIVFTGTLSSMVRTNAQQLILDTGGIVGKDVTKNTDYLIVGQQDYRVVGDEGMSSKQVKAVKLIEKGSGLEILSEEDFLKNL